MLSFCWHKIKFDNNLNISTSDLIGLSLDVVLVNGIRQVDCEFEYILRSVLFCFSFLN